jgi:hypothetical protein
VRQINLLLLSASLIVTAAAAGAAQTQPNPKQVADKLTGDDKGKAVDNPQCKLFTQSEIAKYIGEPVSGPENAAGGTGCQWAAVDESGDAMVQVVPSEYHTPPTLQEGYKPLPNIGARGYVAPFLDGWVAAAVVGKEAILASVAGSGASDAMAVALLTEVIKRRKP